MKYLIPEDQPKTLDNGHTYMEVTFYPEEGKPFREDFVTNVQPTGSRVVTDKQGRWKLAGARGGWIHPDDMQPDVQYEFERETFEVDVAARLTENIERFLHRRREDGTNNAERIEAGLLTGSRVSRELAQRVLPEPAEFLKAPAVRAIAGREVDVPVDRAAVDALKAERGRG